MLFHGLFVQVVLFLCMFFLNFKFFTDDWIFEKRNIIQEYSDEMIKDLFRFNQKS